MMLSMVNNGQYWAELQQYGTYGGANGTIAPPRLAPYATLWQGSKNGHSPGYETFTQNDVVTYINDAITAGNFPQPQANDNLIYMVLTPNGSRLQDCSQAYCCNWPASYNGTPYTAAECEDPAGTAHELIEAIAGYELTGGNGNGQIADPCGCDVENVNSWSVASYWSSRLGKCVVPESWNGLYVNSTGAHGWWQPPGSFNIRQGYGGSGGVVATDATENGANGNNVHFYNGNKWVQFGTGGSQFAAGGGIRAGIAMDPKWGINYYKASNSTWYAAGGPNSLPPTSVTVTSNGVIVATDPSANPWYFDPSNPGWHHIAGAGDQFIASGTEVLALNPTHNDVFYWPGPGYGFYQVESGSFAQIIANPEIANWLTTSPGQQAAYELSNVVANGWQFAVSSVSNLTYVWLAPNELIYACPGSQCELNGYYTYGQGGWLMSGAEGYVTGCYGGAQPCDLY
jgi:hypothetical protein